MTLILNLPSVDLYRTDEETRLLVTTDRPNSELQACLDQSFRFSFLFTKAAISERKAQAVASVLWRPAYWPNELVAEIHPRMAVILPERHHAAWLGETDNEKPKSFTGPLRGDK
jgi:hypothetical protein